MLLASLDVEPNRKGPRMQEQPHEGIINEMESPPGSRNELLEQNAAKRKKREMHGFIILLIGFAIVLIPNPTVGKFGEYTMFAGAMMYFSGRLIK